MTPRCRLGRHPRRNRRHRRPHRGLDRFAGDRRRPGRCRRRLQRHRDRHQPDRGLSGMARSDNNIIQAMQMVQCLQEITPAMVAKLYLMPARLIRPDILPGAFSFPSAGGRVNFAHYLGRASEEAGFLDGASRFPSSNLVNILGDAHYMLPNKILGSSAL